MHVYVHTLEETCTYMAANLKKCTHGVCVCVYKYTLIYKLTKINNSFGNEADIWVRRLNQQRASQEDELQSILQGMFRSDDA